MTGKNKYPHFSEITVPASRPMPAHRHGDIERLAEDVFYVDGQMPSTSARHWFARMFIRYARTMTIVRQSGDTGENELTLFNTIRLNDEALESLERFGRVRNVVRLGSFHGVDDAFYVQKFGAEYWMLEGMQMASGLEVTPRFLSMEKNAVLPVSGSNVLIFEGVRFPEAIYVLSPTADRQGLAISTDAIQNHTSIWRSDNSLLVSLAIRYIGLAGRARLGPIWLGEQVPRSRSDAGRAERMLEISRCLRPQFESLLTDYDFDMLISGHGWPIPAGAKAAIRHSIEEQLPR